MTYEQGIVGPIAVSHDPQAEERDLCEYLGEHYDRAKLEHYQPELDAEVASVADEAELYRTSCAYLYNLTAFAMTGTKVPYLNYLIRQVAPGARLLDYGCGIGSDGLALLEAGYRVEFADFANPSTEFLRWRLAKRGLDAPIHDLDRHVPDGFDAAYAFDVIEHVKDPFAFLAEMESRAALVEVNFLEYDSNEQELHYELPIVRLIWRSMGRRLVLYRRLHGTSHLVIYGVDRVGPTRLPVNAARVAVGAVRPFVRH